MKNNRFRAGKRAQEAKVAAECVALDWTGAEAEEKLRNSVGIRSVDLDRDEPNIGGYKLSVMVFRGKNYFSIRNAEVAVTANYIPISLSKSAKYACKNGENKANCFTFRRSFDCFSRTPWPSRFASAARARAATRAK